MVLVVPAVVALAAVVRLLEVEDTLPDLPRPELVADAVLDEYGFDVVLSEKLWRCPPLAGAPGAAGSGQELTVPRSVPARRVEEDNGTQ